MITGTEWRRIKEKLEIMVGDETVSNTEMGEYVMNC
jgi:hypothetical protein